jgi:hypothetical protein
MTASAAPIEMTVVQEIPLFWKNARARAKTG